MQFAVTADCHFPMQKIPCFTVRINIQTKRLNPVKAGRAPVNRHYQGFRCRSPLAPNGAKFLNVAPIF
ncbi:hypothetical protein DPMN_096904 [Dreissena polymorpha]|uniref:Uncharacterized protein n=1 Tax=Dreissena polymorpha TaxID=45954 RepID=A0A9D4L9K8_DREPO|nr:hypothetical protein DPMN_096904 [Dreissena polymorpha]